MAMAEGDLPGTNGRSNTDAPSRNNKKTTTRRNRARSNAAPPVDEGPSPETDRAPSIITTSSDEPLQSEEQPPVTLNATRTNTLAGEKSVHSLLADPTTGKLLLHCKASPSQLGYYVLPR